MFPTTLNPIFKERVMRKFRMPDLDITGTWVVAVIQLYQQ
ncbi:hypothetical protein ACFKAS_004366 [Salmonella enterica]